MGIVIGTFVLAGLALSAPFGWLAQKPQVRENVVRADQGFYRDRIGHWRYVGQAKLTGWQVHVIVEGKRVVCESPTIHNTEVIVCDEILLIDEAVPEDVPAPPKKTAYDGPIPEPFIPSAEAAYDLEARLDRIYAGLEPRKK